MDAMIIGGGIGGLTAALSWHAHGIRGRIRVFEAAPEIKPLGVGINLLPHACRELTQLGLRADLAAVAVEPKERGFFTHHGQLILMDPTGIHAGHKWPHFSIHRGELQMVLARAVRERLGPETICCGHRCVDLAQDADGVTAHFVDSAGCPLPAQRASVLIGADGLHSIVRKKLYPDEGMPVFRGINMWRGVTKAKPFLSGGTIAQIGAISRTGKLVVYPIRNDIDGLGTQLINWVAEFTGDQRDVIDWSKPGKLDDFYDVYKDWNFPWLDAARLLREAEFILCFPMADREPVNQWAFGRVALLGDAAHPMYPRGGNGGAQAILDAVALAQALAAAGAPESGLQDYEQRRLQMANRVVIASRDNPPDLVIEEVERITGGKRFDNLDQIIAQHELRKIVEGFAKTAGSDRAMLAQHGDRPADLEKDVRTNQ